MGQQPSGESDKAPVEDEAAEAHGLSSSKARTLIASFFLALPAVFFFTFLLRKSLNVPFLDDYDALLDCLNHLAVLKTASSKALYLLTLQHNEYKLIFGEAVAWLQFSLWGHVDFRILCALGNGFIFLLAILLWKMFLPGRRDLATRLALFIPVSWLLFQLEYYETLNWAMAGLQNLPVLFFSFGAIYFLVRGERWAFCGALVLVILAVSASGNGLAVLPIGVLTLARPLRYLRMAGWLVVSAVCVAAYAYCYNPMLSQNSEHRSVFAALIRLNPAYVLLFMGGAAGLLPSIGFSLLLGILLCAFFIYVARRGYLRKNRAVSYCVLFLLLTSIGVAGIRSNFGVAQSIPSRYTIHSVLLLIFAWFAMVEQFVQHSRAPILGNRIFIGALIFAGLFSLLADAVGAVQIVRRDRALVQAMTEFQHPTFPNVPIGPAPALALAPPIARAVSDTYNLRARTILNQSTSLGIYGPPNYERSGPQ
jgi:hypothetical protein